MLILHGIKKALPDLQFGFAAWVVMSYFARRGGDNTAQKKTLHAIHKVSFWC